MRGWIILSVGILVGACGTTPAYQQGYLGDANDGGSGSGANQTQDAGTAGDPGSGEACGGIQGLGCPAGFFCDFENGTCGYADQMGLCRPRPEGCTLDYAPVCGCDGQTYSNACAAHAAGVDVARDGECEQRCGGIQGLGCPGGFFCDFENGSCGYADQMGLCRPRPQACTREYAPVCGCDGQTYSNACSAHAAGVDVAREGECEQRCGGIIGLGCPRGFYCDFENDSCGYADQMGLCQPRPQACTDDWTPVCGCDGQTHSNACEAHAAGVDVAHAGECEQRCGGIAGFACPEGFFCDYEGSTCGYADQMGLCKPRPQACIDLWDPVCGCDGQTHSNTCSANAAGVDVAHAGACP